MSSVTFNLEATESLMEGVGSSKTLVTKFSLFCLEFNVSREGIGASGAIEVSVKIVLKLGKISGV